MAAVLLTGMNSRQANPDARSNSLDISFTRVFADALRFSGHDVTHGNSEILAPVDQYAHVFVGLAPLHGLGSNRAYQALSAIMRVWGTDGDRLTFFVDDPEIGKTTGGIRTMTTDPNRLSKPFFAYRLEAELAMQPTYAAWFREGVKMLNENQWPRLIVPHFAWSDPTQHYHKFAPQADGVLLPLDLSAFLDTERYPIEAERERVWITELFGNKKWLDQQRTVNPRVRLHPTKGKGDEVRPPDAKLVERYSKSWGVLQAPFITPGAWHTRLHFASAAGAAYASRWQDMAPLGESYTMLPESIDLLSEDERNSLVQDQRNALVHATPSKDNVRETLNSFLKSEVKA